MKVLVDTTIWSLALRRQRPMPKEQILIDELSELIKELRAVLIGPVRQEVLSGIPDPAKFEVEFPFLLSMLRGSFMSRRNTIVLPGGKMGIAMEIILAPIIDQLMNRGRGSFKSERQRH